jgi:hypothetical protein
VDDDASLTVDGWLTNALRVVESAHDEGDGEGALSETEEPTGQASEAPASQTDAVHSPPPLPATSTAAQGPIGRPRGVAFVIVLSIVTFGIYHLYWVYKSFDEMQRHTRQGIGGVLALVIAILLGIVIWFVMPSEVGRMYRDDGRVGPMTGWTGLWVLLPIVGWFVWVIKIQRALNAYWESKAVAGASSAG